MTDNAPVMKTTWKMIENRFPHISVYGCAAHTINLLVKDIADTTNNAKTIKDAENIIKFFKNHHLIKAKVDQKRPAFKITKSFSMAVATRWLSLCTLINNLQALKYVLIQLANKETKLIKGINPRQL